VEEKVVTANLFGGRLARLALLTVGGILAGCIQALLAQEVPAPTIRVTTHMVLVDVVVSDKQGKPVTGLSAEDFALEEKGKVQKIASFTASAGTASAQGPLPPCIYTNRHNIARRVVRSQSSCWMR
jgi:hypothetical protein